MLKSLNITKEDLFLYLKHFYPDLQSISIVEKKFKNFELIEEEINENWYVVLQTNKFGEENDR